MANDAILQYMNGRSTMVDMLHRVKSRAKSAYTNMGMEQASLNDPRYAHHFPIFHQSIIPLMLKDSRIRFGLNLIKGPITTYTRFFTTKQSQDPNILKAIAEQELYFAFQVKGDNDEHEQMLIDIYNRFWIGGLDAALKAIEWGYSGSQIHYCRGPDGKITFDHLEYYSPTRVRVATKDGALIGIYLLDTKQYIPFPKAFWHVHQRQISRYYGLSRLEGAHVPWHETWTYGGARDIRRLWYFKNAFDSGIMRCPVSQSTKGPDGNPIPNLDIAATIMENRMTGAYMILDSAKDAEGNYMWDFEPPASAVAPQGLLEYPEQLDKEKLEGMGIPPEVVEQKGSSGLGAATGRKIPYVAFISTLFPLVIDVCVDVQTQIHKPICMINKQNPYHTLVPIIPQMDQIITGTESAGPAGE